MWRALDARRRPLALSAAFAAGAALRLWRFSGQILGGDELHGVRAALRMPLGELLTTFLPTDPCLPYAAYQRLLLVWGLPFGEVAIRLPSLVAGLALLIALPRVATRRFGAGAGLAVAWLTAISPMLVVYSRVARPYVLVALFAVLAWDAIERWLEVAERGAAARRERLGPAVTYVVVAAATVWLNVVAAPAALAPLGWAALRAVRRGQPIRKAGRALGRVALLALATAVTIALLLGPAAGSLAGVIADKQGGGRMTELGVIDALENLAGGGAVVAVPFCLLALAGWWLLWRRRRGLALASLVPVAAQVAAVAVASPFGVGDGLVLARYWIAILPLVLCWVGVAVAAAGERLGARGSGGFRSAVPLTLIVLGLAGGGPLLRSSYLGSSFTTHSEQLSFHRRPARLDPSAVPAFYKTELPPGALLELPWPSIWRMGRVFPAYQRIHGRPVMVSSLERALRDPRLALRNLHRPEPTELAGSGARFLVVHLDLGEEERALARAASVEAVLTGPRARFLRDAAGRLAQRLERRWGRPVYADESLRVWDLSAVDEPRSGGGAGRKRGERRKPAR